MKKGIRGSKVTPRESVNGSKVMLGRKVEWVKGHTEEECLNESKVMLEKRDKLVKGHT